MKQQAAQLNMSDEGSTCVRWFKKYFAFFSFFIHQAKSNLLNLMRKKTNPVCSSVGVVQPKWIVAGHAIHAGKHYNHII